MCVYVSTREKEENDTDDTDQIHDCVQLRRWTSDPPPLSFYNVVRS